MKNIDISLTKHFYRGNNSYCVLWKSNGLPGQREFASNSEAQSFVNELKNENGGKLPEVASEDTLSKKTEDLLQQLNTTPAVLNAFLEELTKKTQHSFEKWQEYVDQSIDIRIKATKLAFNQAMTADDYLEKLKSLGDASIDSVITVYSEHHKVQAETREILDDYIGKLRLHEGDEDEVEFVERKVSRFLESFEFNIFSVEDADVLRYLSAQKGSSAARSRLEEIVFDFKAFAEKCAPEVAA